MKKGDLVSCWIYIYSEYEKYGEFEHESSI